MERKKKLLTIDSSNHVESSSYVDEKIKLMKQCKIKFFVSVDFIDEMEMGVVPLDVCGVAFGILYMYMRDEIFLWRSN